MTPVDFITYVEKLAVDHPLVNHSEGGKIRFFDLQETFAISSSTVASFPVVLVSEEGYRYTGVDGLRKNKEYVLMVLDKVSDPADHKLILAAKRKCESILDDFIRSIIADRRSRSYNFLVGFDHEIEVSTVSTMDNNLYGKATVITLSYMA